MSTRRSRRCPSRARRTASKTWLRNARPEDSVYCHEDPQVWIQEWKHPREGWEPQSFILSRRQPEEMEEHFHSILIPPEPVNTASIYSRPRHKLRATINPRNQGGHHRDEEWLSAWSRQHQCWATISRRTSDAHHLSIVFPGNLDFRQYVWRLEDWLGCEACKNRRPIWL